MANSSANNSSANNSNADGALSSDKLLNLMRQSLVGSDNSSHTIKTPVEAFALFAHSCMLAVDFTLLGFSEDDRLESPIDATNIMPLPTLWNSSSSYGFRYKHTQSSMQYLLKIYRLGGKSVVTGLGLGDDKTATLEVTTNAFFSESFFPYELKQDSEASSLQDGFISTPRITNLAGQFKTQIIQKLIPSLFKPGYEEEKGPEMNAAPSSQAGRRRIDPLRDDGPMRAPERMDYDPLRYPPRIPRSGGEQPPGFEDEYEVNRGPRNMPFGGRNPLSIGADDLNPPGLGRNPDLVGPFFGQGGQGGGMNPYGEFGGPGGGGMYPTGTHPMFGGGQPREPGQGDPRFPPGSRYDPVGPGDDFPTNFGPRGSGGGRGGFGGYGSGDFI